MTLQVRAGEIVGVAGVAGNGQRELAETISGMRSPSVGTVQVAGRRLRGGDPRERNRGRRRARPRGPARHGARSQPDHHAQCRDEDVPVAARVSRAAAAAGADGGDRAVADRALRRQGPRHGDTRAQPLRRQPPEARARARVPGQAGRAHRRPADARPRRRRDRDRPRLPARGGRRGRGGARHQRGPRRDPRTRRPRGGDVRGRSRRRARRLGGHDRGDRVLMAGGKR